jgi:hypothetical protein
MAAGVTNRLSEISDIVDPLPEPVAKEGSRKKREDMDLIFERPGLYVGYGSVSQMQAFVDGFGLGAGEPSRDMLYQGFTQWMIKRRECRGQYSWSAIATLVGVSEQGSFKVAKEFWDEYKQSVAN